MARLIYEPVREGVEVNVATRTRERFAAVTWSKKKINGGHGRDHYRDDKASGVQSELCGQAPSQVSREISTALQCLGMM